MDRFREPTFDEDMMQAAIEVVYEELFEELGREPTDIELQARIDYYQSEAESQIDNMIDDYLSAEEEE